MSPLAIIGLIWLGIGVLTIGVAVRMKVRPLVLWFMAGPLLGPFSLFWLGAAVAQKKRIAAYYDGSSPYGGGAFLGNAGFGG
jgi:predicted Kef-type K+ transport protein